MNCRKCEQEKFCTVKSYKSGASPAFIIDKKKQKNY